MTEKTRESGPPLIKQIWELLEDQFDISEKREMTKSPLAASGERWLMQRVN